MLGSSLVLGISKFFAGPIAGINVGRVNGNSFKSY